MSSGTNREISNADQRLARTTLINSNLNVVEHWPELFAFVSIIAVKPQTVIPSGGSLRPQPKNLMVRSMARQRETPSASGSRVTHDVHLHQGRSNHPRGALARPALPPTRTNGAGSIRIPQTL